MCVVNEAPSQQKTRMTPSVPDRNVTEKKRDGEIKRERESVCGRRKLWGLLMTHAVLLTVPIHHTPLHTQRHTLQSSQAQSTNKYTRMLKDKFPFFQHREIKINIEYLKWNNNHLKPETKHFDNQRYKVTIKYTNISEYGV